MHVCGWVWPEYMQEGAATEPQAHCCWWVVCQGVKWCQQFLLEHHWWCPNLFRCCPSPGPSFLSQSRFSMEGPFIFVCLEFLVTWPLCTSPAGSALNHLWYPWQCKWRVGCQILCMPFSLQTHSRFGILHVGVWWEVHWTMAWTWNWLVLWSETYEEWGCIGFECAVLESAHDTGAPVSPARLGPSPTSVPSKWPLSATPHKLHSRFGIPYCCVPDS